MNIEEIRDYCLAKPGVTEGFPFNDTALVFKVAGKMFALLDLSEDNRGISLKCDPELAILMGGSITDRQLKDWIDHSYDLVVKSLPGYRQKEL